MNTILLTSTTQTNRGGESHQAKEEEKYKETTRNAIALIWHRGMLRSDQRRTAQEGDQPVKQANNHKVVTLFGT